MAVGRRGRVGGGYVTGSYFVLIPDLKTRKLAHFKVPYDVYVYIKQLEHAAETKLNEPERRDET
jgi:hypothetical protein